MTEGEPNSYPTNSIAKEDLLFCRPNWEVEIEALADSDVERIANKVGEAIQEAYWMALGIVLADYLHVEDVDWNDMGLESSDISPYPSASP